MSDKPRLVLPERSVTQKGLGAGRIVLALIALGLLVAILVMQLRGPGPRQVELNFATEPGWTAERQRALAMKLEDRNLHEAAADAWKRYLLLARPAGADAGKIYYRIARRYQQDGRYQQAIAAFYRAEELLDDEGLKVEIGAAVIDCFERLGQLGDLTRDLAARTTVGDAADGQSGSKLLAEVGGMKMTVADLDNAIKHEIDLSVGQIEKIDPDQAAELRDRLAKRYADPDAKQQKLQEIIQQKILAKEARKEGIDKTRDVREMLAMATDRMLASMLLGRVLADKLNLTDGDVQRYYDANKDKYVEPARVDVAHVLVTDEKQANDLIAEAREGADFDALAKEHSQDQGTKDSGGRLPGHVAEEGDWVPGIGQDKALRDAIWRTKKGEALDKPHKSTRGFHVIKVVDRAEKRQLPFDKVTRRVRQDLAEEKQKEIIEQYVRDLYEQHDVKIYPSVPRTEATSKPAP